ncbi:hypothetical protein HI914_05104 [Erysiphe necator]|nr:hypothetical protein HI914_05104 [Erysiphe necator]
MRYFELLTLLALAHAAVAGPISLQARAKGSSNNATSTSQSSQSSKSSTKAAQSSGTTPNVTKDSVSRAADNFAQDAGIVSNAINKMTSMTDQSAIKDAAQRAFDAESDEDNQRQILAAAAGSAGDSANGKIMKFTPTVLNGLNAIVMDPSPDSVQMNTKMMEDPRNANILPSITQLSNAALDAMGLDMTAPKLRSTTGASGNNNNNNNSDNNNNNNNSDNNNNNNNSDNNNNNNNSDNNNNNNNNGDNNNNNNNGDNNNNGNNNNGNNNNGNNNNGNNNNGNNNNGNNNNRNNNNNN